MDVLRNLVPAMRRMGTEAELHRRIEWGNHTSDKRVCDMKNIHSGSGLEELKISKKLY